MSVGERFRWVRWPAVMLVLGLIMGLGAGVAWATPALENVYVAATGSDESGDGSSGSPFATIAKGLEAVASGGTVRVAAGTYPVAETIVVDNSGVTISGPTTGTARIVGTTVNAVTVFSITAPGVSLVKLEMTVSELFEGYPADEALSSLVAVRSTGDAGVVLQNNKLSVPAQVGPMSGWVARGITVVSSGPGVEILGNTICNTRNGVVIRPGNTAAITGNRIYNTKGGIMNYTSSQADANSRTVLGNTWGTAHNEWDIVWNTAYYVPDYQASVLALSGHNNGAYVLDRRAADAGACAGLTGNRSHVFVQAASGHSAAHPAKGNANEPFDSVQLGVNAAVPGGRVYVAGGTYVEQVVINKNLCLTGVGPAVVSPPTSVSSFGFPESSRRWEPVIIAFGGSADGTGNISGAGTVTVNLSNLIVDGADRAPTSGRRSTGILFRNGSGSITGNTIRNMGIDGAETFGIILHGDSEVTVSANHVSGWARGGIGVLGDFGSNGKGPLPDPVAAVAGNTVLGPGMGVPVTWAPNGIQFGYGAAGEIRGNTVRGCGWPGEAWSGSGIIVVATDGVTVAENVVAGNETGVAVLGWMWNPSGATAEGNTIRGNTIADNEYGILLQDKAVNTTIERNRILNNLNDGVGVCNFYGHAPTGTAIGHNLIAGSDPSGADGRVGLWVDEDVPEVDARNNWWGHASGPYHETLNPEGLGDPVIGDALISPWDTGLLHFTAPAVAQTDESYPLVARLTMSDGTPLDVPIPVTFTAGRGYVVSPVSTSGGVASTTWASGSFPGSTVLTASAAGLFAEADLTITIPVVTGFSGSSGDGLVTVDVPDFVHNRPVTLTITASTDPPPTVGFSVVGSVYDVTLTVTAGGASLRNLKRSLTISFYYTEADLAAAGISDPAQLRLWYWDTAATPPVWVALPTVVDPVARKASATVDHLTPFGLMLNPTFVSLTDIEGHWAEAAILRLASSGAVSGFEDKSFRPEMAVTRAQFSKFLAASMGLPLEPTLPPGADFSDAASVPTWAVPYVGACVRTGVLTGDGGRLRPNDVITRNEAAVMISRALQVSPLTGWTAFADWDTVPEWAQGYVARVAYLGIVTGMSGNVFDGSGTLTRGQAVTMLSRAMNVR